MSSSLFSYDFLATNTSAVFSTTGKSRFVGYLWVTSHFKDRARETASDTERQIDKQTDKVTTTQCHSHHISILTTFLDINA